VVSAAAVVALGVTATTVSSSVLGGALIFTSAAVAPESIGVTEVVEQIAPAATPALRVSDQTRQFLPVPLLSLPISHCLPRHLVPVQPPLQDSVVTIAVLHNTACGQEIEADLQL
jgi:hypothetical protein